MLALTDTLSTIRILHLFTRLIQTVMAQFYQLHTKRTSAAIYRIKLNQFNSYSYHFFVGVLKLISSERLFWSNVISKMLLSCFELELVFSYCLCDLNFGNSLAKIHEFR